jgi:hypothetical protein
VDNNNDGFMHKAEFTHVEKDAEAKEVVDVCKIDGHCNDV